MDSVRVGMLAYLCLQATKEGQASYAHVHEIIRGLGRRGWEIQLFEPVYPQSKITVLNRVAEAIACQVRLLLSMHRFDVVYIRFHYLTIIASVICKIFGKTVIQEINGPYEDAFIAWPWTRRIGLLLRLLMKFQYRLADAVVVVTPQLKDWLLSEFGEALVEVIPNGANTELFTPDAKTDVDLPAKFVMFFGALSAWQGIDCLLEAAASANWPKDLSLVIVGDGEQRERVIQASRENSRVLYLGQQPYQRLPGMISRSIAGLAPKNNLGDRSRTGLSPLKLFETLSCGVPAVVTDFPGQADFVRLHNCGLVVPPDEPDLLAAAVSTLAEDRNLRTELGRRARETVLKQHSWDKRSEQTHELISSVTNGER